MPEIKFKDLLKSENMGKKEKNGWLRELGLMPNTFGDLKKMVQTVLKSNKWLTAEELLGMNGQEIDWHLEYLSEKEDWKDGDAPLLVDDVHLVDGPEDSKQVYIHYTCSRKDCHSCHHGMEDLRGHFMILEAEKYSGMKYYGKVSEVVLKKKMKTFSVLHPVPVFKLYEE